MSQICRPRTKFLSGFCVFADPRQNPFQVVFLQTPAKIPFRFSCFCRPRTKSLSGFRVFADPGHNPFQVFVFLQTPDKYLFLGFLCFCRPIHNLFQVFVFLQTPDKIPFRFLQTHEFTNTVLTANMSKGAYIWRGICPLFDWNQALHWVSSSVDLTSDCVRTFVK